MFFVNLIYGHLYILMFQNGPAKKVVSLRAVYQTYSNSTCQYLRVSGGVWCRLLSSVDILSSLELSGGCLGDIWGMSGDIWVVLMETGGTQTCLKGIWDSSPYNMEPLHYFGTALKRTTFFAWPYWGIKISKCLYIRFTKIIGLWDFFVF